MEVMQKLCEGQRAQSPEVAAAGEQRRWDIIEWAHTFPASWGNEMQNTWRRRCTIHIDFGEARNDAEQREGSQTERKDEANGYKQRGKWGGLVSSTSGWMGVVWVEIVQMDRWTSIKHERLDG